MQSILSVIIATRGRDNNLQRCLESLLDCDVPAGWTAEILVVDNGCSKYTRKLVSSLSSGDALIQFRYLCDSRQGKSYAVNRGVANARGRILLFTDDDVIVDKEWLEEMVQEFCNDPGLGLVAGRVEPATPEGPLVAVTRFLERTPLNDLPSLRGSVLGCNLAIRSGVLAKVKGRDTRLGPGRGLACEDIDFTYRVLRNGFRGVFSPKPVVYHEPGERDRAREYLRGWGAFYLKFILKGDRQVARQMWWQMHRIWRDFWVEAGDPFFSLNQIWHLTVGAMIMARRIGISILSQRSPKQNLLE